MNRNEYKSRSVSLHISPLVDNIAYTCPNNFTAHIVLLFISNLGSGNKTVTVKWYNSHLNDYFYIVGGYVIGAYGFLKLDGSYLTLNANDQIIFSSEAGSVMDGTLTVEEFYDPTRRE